MLVHKRFYLRELGVAVSLTLIVLVFRLLSPAFFSLATWSTILSAASELGIASIGVTLLIISGEFDLSIGANFGFSALCFAILTTHFHIASMLACGFCLLIASIIGWINGCLTIYCRIPSFIATLGTLFFWRGIILLISQGMPITPVSDNWVMRILSPTGDMGFLHGFILWIILAAVCNILLQSSAFGNHLLATGGNTRIAFNQGINTSHIKMTCFILCGLLAGLAGILQYSHLGGFMPTAGNQYELSAIAAVVIGGTLLTGGVGTLIGSTLGVLLINVINSGLIQAGASTYWYGSFVGIILIIAVIINLNISTLLDR